MVSEGHLLVAEETNLDAPVCCHAQPVARPAEMVAVRVCVCARARVCVILTFKCICMWWHVALEAARTSWT